MWLSFPGWPLGMYIIYPGSSEKKGSPELILDQKVRGNKSHPSIIKKTNKKFLILSQWLTLFKRTRKKSHNPKWKKSHFFLIQVKIKIKE